VCDVRKWPIPSDGSRSRLGLIYKTGGKVTETHYYERILEEAMRAYHEKSPGKAAENNDAVIKKLEERIYIIEPLEVHFWAPFLEGDYDALSLLWLNIARDNVPNNCLYLAVVSGVTDIMSTWGYREGKKDQALPYVRLSDALVEAAGGKIRELRERGRPPKVFLAGTASMTNHHSALLDLFEQKGATIMKFSEDHYSALWDLFEQKGATMMRFSERKPEQQLNDIIVACEREGRLPNTEEQVFIRTILVAASGEVDILALTCYELESCIDDATEGVITKNGCEILCGATLHATKLGKIVTSLLTT
jgi:hypothetical protein